MHAAPTPAKRVVEIQRALQAAKLDGWLFYDFRGSDPLALRVLKLDQHAVGSQRWFYFIPAFGDCTKLLHRIEPAKLDALPGKRVEYSGWKECIQHRQLRDARFAPHHVGCCFSFEPGIYLPGKFGVRSEIDVDVRDDDIEVTGQPIQTEIVAILKPR